jgi:hypothetical protein
MISTTPRFTLAVLHRLIPVKIPLENGTKKKSVTPTLPLLIFSAMPPNWPWALKAKLSVIGNKSPIFALAAYPKKFTGASMPIVPFASSKAMKAFLVSCGTHLKFTPNRPPI